MLPYLFNPPSNTPSLPPSLSPPHREVPSLLEYWSYNYNFHTFLAGPACTMKEYLNFVDGSNFTTKTSRNGSNVKACVCMGCIYVCVCVGGGGGCRSSLYGYICVGACMCV